MIKQTITGVTLFAVAAGSAFTMTDIKIDDIKGEARVMGGGGGAGKVNVQDITAIKANRAELQEARGELQQEVADQREEMKVKAQEARATTMEAGKELQDEFQAEMDAATTEEEKQAVKEKYAEMRGELREDAAEAREELKEERMNAADEMKEKRKDFLEKRLENILRKYQAYQKRAHSVYDRIEFNIEKLEEAGVDVTTLEKMQGEGKALIDAADAAMESAQAGAESILSGSLEKDEIKKNLEMIKEDLAAAKKAMKDYFAGVRELVKELKANKPQDTEEEIAA